MAFGGSDGSVLFTNDVREFDGIAWSVNAAVPELTVGFAMTADPIRGSLLVFGGLDRDDQATNKMWERRGNAWHELSPVTSPPPLSYHSITYDERRRVTVVYGGHRATSTSSDTWEFDGTTWRLVPVTQSPPPRESSDMVYDAARGNIVVFGGRGEGGSTLGDTWIYDGTTWTEVATTGPPARIGHRLVYDAEHAVVVLAGGSAGTILFDDTWTWDGTSWHEVSHSFPARYSPAMAYDPASHLVHMFGGGDQTGIVNDTWVWNGAVWQRLSLDPSPPGGIEIWMAYQATQHGTILFAGFESTGRDTWLLQYHLDVADTDELCSLSADVDGDGASGCADTDCAPFCLPTGDPSGPHCGDGACNAALETFFNCPSDCARDSVCGDFTCSPNETIAGCPGDCSP
jgi:hypothetical protein